MIQIKKWRQTRNMTQAQLAARAGLDTTTINHAETGRTGPSTTTLERIAKALSVSLPQLVAGPGEVATTTSKAYQTIQQSVETTGLTERETLHAVCQGHLAHTIVNGRVLLEVGSHNAWLGRGCPGSKLPGDVGETSFDDGALRYFGSEWAGKVRTEIEKLIPDDTPTGDMIRISPTSGNIPKLLVLPTPVTSITDESIKRITRWCDAYLVPALRQHVGIILRGSKGQPHGMARLYDPRYYSEITAEAMSRLKRGSIAVTKYYPAAEAWQESRRVSFELSHADIIGNRGAELITLAF